MTAGIYKNIFVTQLGVKNEIRLKQETLGKCVNNIGYWREDATGLP